MHAPLEVVNQTNNKTTAAQSGLISSVFQTNKQETLLWFEFGCGDGQLGLGTSADRTSLELGTGSSGIFINKGSKTKILVITSDEDAYTLTGPSQRKGLAWISMGATLCLFTANL